jgi:hypothetical protein
MFFIFSNVQFQFFFNLFLFVRQAETGSAGEQPVRNILTDWNGQIRLAIRQPYYLIIPRVDALKNPLTNFSFRFRLIPL